MKMKNKFRSRVESIFYENSGAPVASTNIPYIVVDNFPKLGLITALRFLEWVSENPEGVISLPTGKTPEYFIVWTKYLLDNWDIEKGKGIRNKYGLGSIKKPDLTNLRFVQIDEFYPISSRQKNSFYNYVKKYYIEGFGLKEKNCLLINSDEIPLEGGKHFTEIFPDSTIDLSIRYREPRTKHEVLQQKSVYAIDNWCTNYEAKVRALGGIGFFLGGIGPDGHIAFNTRGSDFHSTTRLTPTNFETQAVAAGDLGGIEISKNRLVITIGLETITYNPEAVAIIFAAGEAKAPVVKNALEESPSVIYPASVLSKMKNSCFYLTSGAAASLEASVESYYKEGEWNQVKTDRAVIDLCQKLEKYGHHLTLEDLKNDKYCSLIPNLNNQTVKSVIDSTLSKLSYGMRKEIGQTFYHTGPHHDDIMLGLLPHIHRIMREESNKSVFSVLTSGFTAVTNKFVISSLTATKKFMDKGLIQMLEYPDFFESGYKYKWDKDVYHYLIKIASVDGIEQLRGLSHRIVRAIIDIYAVKNKEHLRNQIDDILANFAIAMMERRILLKFKS